MTSREIQAQAAERRRRVLAMREQGLTWLQIGRALGVTASRAAQIGRPTPVRLKPRRTVPGNTTLREYIEANAKRVEECARAVMLALEVSP